MNSLLPLSLGGRLLAFLFPWLIIGHEKENCQPKPGLLECRLQQENRSGAQKLTMLSGGFCAAGTLWEEERTSMKKLVVILGPHAVGKMTVGQELAKISGLRLLHNHMTIELVRNFFSVHGSQEGARINNLFRQEIFGAVARSDLPGLIFTFMFDFDATAEYVYINALISLFKSNGADACVVELRADYDVRIERNKTENRLVNKPSKRDVTKSEALFRGLESVHRLNSRDDEAPFENYFRIDNTYITPEKTAVLIKEKFGL
jgi:hypothetical protein